MIGEDGSTIKSIAFNALENGSRSISSQKNNKTFNIAGKLSLNEWKGESNVEFIIDDISVNKTFKNTVPSSIVVRTVGFHPTKEGLISSGPPKIMKHKYCCNIRNS